MVKKVGVEYEVKGINQFISAIEKAEKAMLRLVEAVEKAAGLFEQAASGMAKSSQASQQFASETKKAEGVQQSFNKTMKESQQATQQVTQTTIRFGNTLKEQEANLAKVRDALKAIRIRILELRASEDAKSKATKANIAVLQQQIAQLRLAEAQLSRMVQASKAVERAEQAKTRAAERAANARRQATEQAGRAAAAAEKAAARQSRAWQRSARQLILWSLGARTVFRLFMRLRRVLSETFVELYKNTEEWKRFTAATDKAKAALVLSLVPQKDFVALITGGTTAMLTWSRIFVIAGAAIGTTGKILENFIGALGVYKDVLAAMVTGQPWEEIAKGMEEFVFEPGEISETFFEEFEERWEQLLALPEAGAEEAEKAFEKFQQRLYQIQEQWLRKRLDIEKHYLQQVNDAQEQFQEDVADIEQERTDERADAWRDLQDKLAQIEEDGQHRRQQLQERFEERMQRIRYQFERGSENARYQHNRRMLRIERQFQERLRQIQITFTESMWDAIASRDATAALRAMRRRDRDIDTAQRQAEGQRTEAREDFARRMFELQRDLDHQTEMARLAYERQLRDLEYALEQRREKAWDAYQKALEDAQESYGKQEQALKDSLKKRLDDLHDHYVQAIADAKFQRGLDLDFAEADYRNAEDALARHIARMQAIRRAYAGIGVRLPGEGPQKRSYATGGEFIATRPTNITVGEGNRAEFVSITPLDRPIAATPTMTHNIAGTVGHSIDVMVGRSIAGMEGRINAALERALTDLMR